jgi:hypothetical protein
MRVHVIIFLFCIGATAEAQTETDRHIHWQADRRLSEEDYMGLTSRPEKAQEYCELYGMCSVASTGFWATLDIPKRKKDRGLLKEKAWFSAVFDKHASFVSPGDTTGMFIQQMVFDVEEFWARWARKELIQFELAADGKYGMTHIMFDEVTKKARKNIHSMVAEIINEVYIAPEEGAIMKWRELIDDLLAGSDELATTPEDAARFMNGAPIDKRYVVAPYLIASDNE